MAETWRTLVETTLEEDSETLDERGTVVHDGDLLLLGRSNRIALAIGDVTALGRSPKDEAQVYEIPLRCVVHPQAGCRFLSVKLSVDFGRESGAVVRDMTPREVRGKDPVEVEVTVGMDLSFEAVPSTTAGVKHERSTRQTVHYPVILTSGRGFSRALWDFRPVQDNDLFPDRDLRLLVAAPPRTPVTAKIDFRAQVAVGRAGAVIPLLRRKAEVQTEYLVTSGA